MRTKDLLIPDEEELENIEGDHCICGHESSMHVYRRLHGTNPSVICVAMTPKGRCHCMNFSKKKGDGGDPTKVTFHQ
jgi:hypothetical protein